jgi:hypothetical protein
MADNKYDFSECMIDFTRCPNNERLVKFFPELSVYPEFNDAEDNLISIAICITDLKSPFIRVDHQLRLTQIFDFLGMGLKTQKNQELFHNLLFYKHVGLINMCARYLQHFNNHDFTRWWTLNLSYYEIQRAAIEPKMEGEDINKYYTRKMSMQGQMDTMSNKLIEYEERLFDDAKLKQAIHAQKLKEKIHTYPEQFAQQFPGFHN